jgi:hypothetical protein
VHKWLFYGAYGGFADVVRPERLRWVIAPRSVAPEAAAAAVLGSVGIVAFALGRDWPLWLVGLGSLIPWVPLFWAELFWTYRNYGWLALFYLLVVSQSGHFFEHIVQVTQIHVFQISPPQARGVISTLDTEWVHFLWNTWVIVAAVVLARRFPENIWLRVTAVLAGWHEAEHIFIMSQYLMTGVAGTPGLLSKGGAILGGLPFIRPDLHFIYNLIETAPLMMAFLCQVDGVCERQRREVLARIRRLP